VFPVRYGLQDTKTYRRHIQQAQFYLLSASCLAHSSNLKMEAIWDSEMSAKFSQECTTLYQRCFRRAVCAQIHFSFNFKETYRFLYCILRHVHKNVSCGPI
jgi:hypothetical protein